jgi:hypothetical protein
MRLIETSHGQDSRNDGTPPPENAGGKGNTGYLHTQFSSSEGSSWKINEALTKQYQLNVASNN